MIAFFLNAQEITQRLQKNISVKYNRTTIRLL